MQSLPALLDARLRAVTGVDPEMRPATKPQFGHFQSNVALRLAKEQKRPPREVAADIVAQLDVSDLCEPSADQAFHMDGARAASHSADAVRAYLRTL